MAKVAILIGSASDIPAIQPCLEVLTSLAIPFTVTISSAHRTPERTGQFVVKALESGAQVFICAAGMAAHLAGAVASRVILPVIGIPLQGSSLAGMDALFSTVQMPAGFPVATVAINGSANGAWLAAQILALHDAELAAKIISARDNMRETVVSQSEEAFPENRPPAKTASI